MVNYEEDPRILREKWGEGLREGMNLLYSIRGLPAVCLEGTGQGLLSYVYSKQPQTTHFCGTLQGRGWECCISGCPLFSSITEVTPTHVYLIELGLITRSSLERT